MEEPAPGNTWSKEACSSMRESRKILCNKHVATKMSQDEEKRLLALFDTMVWWLFPGHLLLATIGNDAEPGTKG